MISQAVRETLFTGQTADTVVAVRDVKGFKYISVYVIGTGTIDTGQVKVEEAHDSAYAGTWAVLDTFDAAEITGGICKPVHCPAGVYGAVRVRITTTIAGTGGSVAAVIIMQH